MSKTTKKILFRFVIAPLVLLILLYLIYLQILKSGSIAEQWTNLKAHWYASNKWIFILVLLLAPINWLTEALKWRIGLEKIYPLSLGHAYKGVLTGISFAMISPGKVGDFAGRILHVPNVYKVKATVATFINNTIQAIATTTFGLLGIIYFHVVYGQEWSRYTLWGGLFLIVVGMVLLGFRKVIWGRIRAHSWIKSNIEKWDLLKSINTTQFWKIYGLSLVRYLIYNLQFLLLILTLGAPISFFSGLLLTFLMFWLIAVIPSFLVADLGVRGFIAGLVFINTGIIDNTLVVLSASYIIWLVNLVLPAILGSVLILFIKHQSAKQNYNS